MEREGPALGWLVGTQKGSGQCISGSSPRAQKLAAATSVLDSGDLVIVLL